METAQVQQPQNAVVRNFNESTVDNVLNRISSFQKSGEMKLPANYSAENAVRSAWLIIQETKNLDKRPALEVCTKESVANALLDMVLQGLSPVKKQCYFIVRGNKLCMDRSYIGTMAVGRRVANVKSIRAIPIYKGDEFAFEIDIEKASKKITKHVQSFENIDPANTIGAYAIVTYNDGTVRAEVMNMKQIKASWEMGQAKGNSKAHIGFADEMACKTVIGRALKTDIGSSSDEDLFDDLEQPDVIASHVQNQIEQEGNKTEIGFEEDVTSHDNEQQEESHSEPEPAQQKPPIADLHNVNLNASATQQPATVNGTKTKAPF